MVDDLVTGHIADLVTGHITGIIAAAGALGTAAFGLVDATKAFGGGVSNAGFGSVRQAVTPFIGNAGGPTRDGAAAFGRDDILATLRANWINGVAKADQKAAAKSLIRLCLTHANAASLAEAVGVDAASLTQIARNIENGTPLTTPDLNLLGRLDAIVSARLDEGYERADQEYRNAAKLLAALIALALAVIGGALVTAGGVIDYVSSWRLPLAILIGAVSTALAPMAKDLSTALVAAVNAITAARR
jgi:hypothetical protein